MIGGMGSAVTPDLSKGGEINGDITITGDLAVSGSSSVAVTDVIEGSMIIDATTTEAFLVRKDSDGGDVFVVDTTNSRVGIGVTAPSTFVEIQDGLTTTGAVLTLSTKETTVVDNDVLGRINFQAPLETGTDAIKVGASIHAEAEDTFSSTINSTGLVFSTHTTDTATERMRITSGGRVDIFCDTSNWPLGIYSYGASASSRIFLVASKGTKASPTDIDAADYQLGALEFMGRESSGQRMAASMRAFTESVWNSNDYPAYLTFNTVPDGAYDETEKMRITSAGNVLIGTATAESLRGFVPHVQVEGTGATTSSISVFRNSADQSGAYLLLGKSRGGAVNADTVVQDDDALGYITFVGADGSDRSPYGATITAYVDGTPGSNDLPARLVFATTADGAGSPTDRMTITSGGKVGINVTAPDHELHIKAADSGHSMMTIESGSVNHQSYLILEADRPAENDTIGNIQFTVADNNAVDIQGFRGASDGVGYLKFRTGTTTRFVIDANSRISLSNNDSGTSNTIFGKSAGASLDADSSYNTFIGEAVSDASMDEAGNNVGVGYGALGVLTQGDNNVAVGSMPLMQNTTGGNNIGIGITALRYNETGAGNVAIGSYSQRGASGQNHSDNTSVGRNSLYSITTGTENVIVGTYAGDALTIGRYNTAVGAYALTTDTIGDYTTAIGQKSLYSQLSDSDNEATHNTAVGAYAGYYNVTGTGNTWMGLDAGKGASGQSNSNNTGIGDMALFAITTGTTNVAVGSRACYSLTTGGGNVAVGQGALDLATTQADYNIAIGQDAINGNWTTADVNDLVGIGRNALAGVLTAASSGTVAIGYNALTALTSGASNLAIGYNAMLTHTTGASNIAIGAGAMDDTDAGSNSLGSAYNIFIGNDAGGGTWTNAAVNYNVGIGNSVMDSALAGVGYTTAVGHNALSAVTSGQYNSVFGTQAGFAITTASDNVAIGKLAMSTHTTGARNIAIGSNAMDDTDAGSTSLGSIDNIFIGFDAGGGTWVDTASQYNVAIGNYAMDAAMNGALNNTALGHQSSSALTTGGGNATLGYKTGYILTTGTNNVMIGRSAGSATTDVDKAVIIGANSGLADMVTADDGTVSIGYYAGGAIANGHHGNRNVLIGNEAGKLLSRGDGNVAIGEYTLDGTSHANKNTAVGWQALTSMDVSSDTDTNNTAVGFAAGGSVTSGAGNTLVGHTAGDTLTTGGENTIVGHACDVASNDNTNNVIIGHDLTATDKDNAVFIGNNTNHIENDFNADATWNYSSDERQKKDIKDDTLGLEFINDLRPVTYKHKSPSEFPKEWSAYDADDKEPMGGDKTIHGLIAQEVKQSLDNQGVDTFGGWSVGDDGRQRISAEKMVMPLIKAVQELSAEVKSLKQQLEDK